jgi:hypothetical protein
VHPIDAPIMAPSGVLVVVLVVVEFVPVPVPVPVTVGANGGSAPEARL